MALWCAVRSRPIGALISLSTAWSLAEAWYADRLQADWRGRTASEAQEVFRRLGLTDPFWQLTEPLPTSSPRMEGS